MVKGFSLIEFMIVIVIIGVIAAAGAPVYRDRYIRATVERELLPVLEDYKNKVQEGIIAQNYSIANNYSNECIYGNTDTLTNTTPYMHEFTANEYIAAVGGLYLDGAHRVAVEANMSKLGINIAATEVPLVISYKISPNGGSFNVICQVHTNYSSLKYVPQYCLSSNDDFIQYITCGGDAVTSGATYYPGYVCNARSPAGTRFGCHW